MRVMRRRRIICPRAVLKNLFGLVLAKFQQILCHCPTVNDQTSPHAWFQFGEQFCDLWFDFSGLLDS